MLLSITSLALACSSSQGRPLEIATTTSVVNSGLLDFVLRGLDAPVRIHAAGSGRSLAMLSDEVVDLVISHAPEAEGRTLAAHPDWRYMKIAFNHFVILGPPADPAKVRTATTAVDAFRRIADHDAVFISRGDQSGTHERETALWRQAQVDPSNERVLASGGSMATALRQADERSAYTLSDEATWRQLQSSLGLEPLLTHDAALLNTYAVVFRAASNPAAALARWLAEGEGRERIAAYRTAGHQPFAVWPVDCPRDKPLLLPCQ